MIRHLTKKHIGKEVVAYLLSGKKIEGTIRAVRGSGEYATIANHETRRYNFIHRKRIEIKNEER